MMFLGRDKVRRYRALLLSHGRNCFCFAAFFVGANLKFLPKFLPKFFFFFSSPNIPELRR